MSFRATCPHCEASFTAEDHYEGKTGKCAKCGQKFVVSRLQKSPPNWLDASPQAEEEPEDDWEDHPLPAKSVSSGEPKKTPPSSNRKFFTEPSARSFYTLKLFADIYLFLAGALIVLGVISVIITIFSERSSVDFYKKRIVETKKELEVIDAEADRFGIQKGAVESRLQRYENALEQLPTYNWLWILLGSLSSAAGCLFIREVIHLGLAVEQNTRNAAELMSTYSSKS